MPVTKRQFIEELAARLGLPLSEAERIVNGLFHLIYEVLKGGDTVNFSGFGQFSVSHRKARLGVNPRTKAKITIPEFNHPRFKAGEAFKEAIKLK